jgi:hypothetical protein
VEAIVAIVVTAVTIAAAITGIPMSESELDSATTAIIDELPKGASPVQTH